MLISEWTALLLINEQYMFAERFFGEGGWIYTFSNICPSNVFSNDKNRYICSTSLDVRFTIYTGVSNQMIANNNISVQYDKYIMAMYKHEQRWLS